MNINQLEPKTDLYGQAFEHFIAMELRAYIHYRRLNMSLSYWCTTHGAEVDFIVGDQVAVEVKAAQKTQDKHLKNIRLLQEENICSSYYVVSFDTINRSKDNTHFIYWQDFLAKLWLDEIIVTG